MGTNFTAIDSHRNVDVSHHRIASVSYEPNWQLLRTGLSFKERESALGSAAELRAYIALATTEQETQYRVWRVYNLLCAVPIGQPSHKTPLMMITLPAEHVLTPFKEHYRQELNRVGKPTTWDWHSTRLALQKMDDEWLFKHYKLLLRQRAIKARQRGKWELEYYLTLVEQQLDGEV